MPPAKAVKLSISVSPGLARSLRRRVGAGNLSAYAARALAHELEREALGALLAELDDAAGPLPESLVDEARRAWPAT